MLKKPSFTAAHLMPILISASTPPPLTALSPPPVLGPVLLRSSLTLSFNDRLSTTSSTTTTTATTVKNPLHHRKCDPHWSAIKTATNLSTDGKLHLRHLKLLRHLGTGNLGRVFLCQLRGLQRCKLCFEKKTISCSDGRRVQKKRMAGSMRRGGNCFGAVNRRGVEEEEVVEEEFVAEPTAASSRSCVGTHEYLAPELLSGNGHGNGVDWWAFGVLVYELLYGTTPFKGGSKESTLRNIASSKHVTFHMMEGEGKAMEEARDLVKKLLVKNPGQRLGCTKGATDIKRHPFFDGINWPLIRNYKPPEVRGLVAKKGRSHPSGRLQGGGRSWWRLWKKGGGGLGSLLRNKGSSPRYCSLSNSHHYNGNYHHYTIV
uniref:non-specific serine/threonine protein kinase n=1 Tax=Salix viminalis TaxID=40686 RepID=A0A6N2MPD7_SALVM